MSLAKTFCVLTIFVLMLGINDAIFADEGDLDPNFGGDGKVTLDIAMWDAIYDSEVLSDGSIVVAGRTYINSQFDVALAKFDASGDPVNEFGGNGFVVTDFGNGDYDISTAIHVLPNGKLLVVGAVNGDFLLAKYNANGTLDTSFGSGGFVTTDVSFNQADIAFGVVVQTNGRIVVAGRAEGLSTGESFIGLAGYTTDGDLDSTFGINGVMNVHVAGNEESPTDMILLDDDRILVTGNIDFNPPFVNAKFFVVRYTADGFPDQTFGDNGASILDLTPSTDTPYAIAVQKDGKIVIGGYVDVGPFDGTQDLALVRFDSEGVPDPTFGNSGVVICDLFGDLLPGNEEIRDISIQNDGKIVVVGHTDLPSNNLHFLVGRFLTNGSLDPIFGDGVIITDFSSGGDMANSVFLTDESIIVAGNSDIGDGDMAIARYLRSSASGDCTGALYCDLFDDGILNPDWSYIKPSWNEIGGSLTGTPSGKKAIAIAPTSWTQSNIYTIQTTLKASGGEFSSVWLFGWYADKKNTIELQMKEGQDKWILKHRVNGVVVAKAKGLKTVLPNTSYSVKVAFDGSQFQVFVDDPTTPLITLTATQSVSVGTVGYQVKNSTASFDSIRVD
jgi:uncharacterized delta-60 repeat protein